MARKTDILYINYYVSGTTACQMEAKPFRKQEVTLPKQRRRKKIVLYVDPMAIMGICVAFVMFILMIVGAVRLSNAQKQAQRMSDYVVSLQQTNTQLRDTYEAGCDLEQIRQIAEARGMIPESEAKQVTVQLKIPEETKTQTAWESFVVFLTSLFA